MSRLLIQRADLCERVVPAEGITADVRRQRTNGLHIRAGTSAHCGTRLNAFLDDSRPLATPE